REHLTAAANVVAAGCFPCDRGGEVVVGLQQQVVQRQVVASVPLRGREPGGSRRRPLREPRHPLAVHLHLPPLLPQPHTPREYHPSTNIERWPEQTRHGPRGGRLPHAIR